MYIYICIYFNQHNSVCLPVMFYVGFFFCFARHPAGTSNRVWTQLTRIPTSSWSSSSPLLCWKNCSPSLSWQDDSKTCPQAYRQPSVCKTTGRYKYWVEFMMRKNHCMEWVKGNDIKWLQLTFFFFLNLPQLSWFLFYWPWNSPILPTDFSSLLAFVAPSSRHSLVGPGNPACAGSQDAR